MKQLKIKKISIKITCVMSEVEISIICLVAGTAIIHTARVRKSAPKI